jgi:hypothetical protein
LQAKIHAKQAAEAAVKQQAEKQKQLEETLATTASKVAEASKCNQGCCLTSWFNRLKGGALRKGNNNKNVANLGQKLSASLCTTNLCKYSRRL